MLIKGNKSMKEEVQRFYFLIIWLASCKENGLEKILIWLILYMYDAFDVQDSEKD